MATPHQPHAWTATDGAVTDLDGRLSIPLSQLPPNLVELAINVDFAESCVFKERKPLFRFSTAGTDPTGNLTALFVESGATASADVLWAFSNGSAWRYASSTWSAVTLIDTGISRVHAVNYNGKVFLAYDSSVNRLHLWDGSAVRRVGIGAVSAPTTANGGGAGVAVIRYYKTQQLIVSGSTVSAASELSSSTSFTPGANGVTVTKSTTVDSATHWRVYGSADNITFYLLSSDIVVGTTTYLDNATPSAYAAVTGEVAPTAGLFVPPPSAKFLATDGERLIMAGAWETTASAGETTPTPRRVWFTRPLGITDEGDDESVTQTGEFRYWLDVDNPAGGPITGLAVLSGHAYVFFSSGIHRLVPTGQPDTPFRAEQIASGVGVADQRALCLGSMDPTGGSSDEAVYFFSLINSGLYRFSQSRGLEWLGRDVVAAGSAFALSGAQLAFDPILNDLWFFPTTSQSYAILIDVSRLQRRGLEYHGGARKYRSADGGATVKWLTGVSYGGEFVFGGNAVTGVSSLHSISQVSAAGLDLSTTAISSQVRSAPLMVPMKQVSVENPTIETHGAAAANFALSVGYVNPFLSTDDSRAQSLTINAGSLTVTKFDGVEMSDAPGVQVEILHSDGNVPHAVGRVVLPYKIQEAA